MSTKGVADVVFCLDASDSMKPCIDGVKTHISSFLEGLKSDGQRTWDVRFDFLAHQTVRGAGGVIGHGHFSLYHSEPDNDVVSVLYMGQQGQRGRFFTTDIAEFKRGLDKVEVLGDEGPLVALDSCLDFPWRKAGECHRVVIFMTDEPFETSSAPELEKQFLEELLQKTQDLKVLLFYCRTRFSRLRRTGRGRQERVRGCGRSVYWLGECRLSKTTIRYREIRVGFDCQPTGFDCRKEGQKGFVWPGRLGNHGGERRRYRSDVSTREISSPA